jgi:hypothetical protein
MEIDWEPCELEAGACSVSLDVGELPAGSHVLRAHDGKPPNGPPNFVTGVLTFDWPGFKRLYNRARKDDLVLPSKGGLTSRPVQPDDREGHWLIEPVAGTPYVRIRHGEKQNYFLHVESGNLVAGEIQEGWHSAMWRLDPVDESGFVTIRNRWKGNYLLNLEHSEVAAAPARAEWWSAQWRLDPASR